MANNKEKLCFNFDFLNTEKINSFEDSNVLNNETKKNSYEKELRYDNSDYSKGNKNKDKRKYNKKSYKKRKQKKQKNSFYELKSIILILIIILIFSIITIYMKKYQEQVDAEIIQLTKNAYEYRITRDSHFYETVKRIADLSNKDIEVIKQEIENKYNLEKNKDLNNLIQEYIQNNSLNANLKQKCIKRYFNNNEKEFNKEVSKILNNKKKEIIKRLIEEWKNHPKDYEINKLKYIKLLFNNNVDKFNQAMDAELGYKQFTLKEQSLPQSGIIENYSDKEEIAPFEIKTQYDDEDSYYIKLVDYNDEEKTILTIFVRAGERITINVPLGIYKLKYASGKTWYGESDLFGHDTIYGIANHGLNFYMDYYRIVGHTLTLYKVENGNFEIDRIEAADF